MRELTEELMAIAGATHVLTDPDLVAGYAADWTGRYRGAARCVVRPGSTNEVAAVVAACAAAGAPVVPQGGNTGLVGGSVPAAPIATAASRRRPALPVILSTRRLTDLGAVDETAAQVTAGAGITIARLAGHAARSGLRYGVDLASRDSATVGGTIATNAGGIRTIRYGPTRAQVAGLTAVLADGSVVSDLSGLTAGAAGYDLAQLLTGSEGTLGVITTARLTLRPAERPAAVLLAGVPGIAQAARLYRELRAAAPLLAAEYIDAPGLELVCRVTGLPRPLRSGWPGYLLAEIAAPSRASQGAGRGADLPPDLAVLPDDVAVAQDGRGMATLWAYRERVTESIATAGIPHKVDVAIPAARLGPFRSELDDAVRGAAAGPGPVTVVVFGHIGVGNLHVNVIGPDPADIAVDEAVGRLAAAHGGSAVAEHGAGRAKATWLGWSRTAAEIAAMRAIKAALDPAGVLNPGVLLSPRPTEPRPA